MDSIIRKQSPASIEQRMNTAKEEKKQQQQHNEKNQTKNETSTTYKRLSIIIGLKKLLGGN